MSTAEHDHFATGSPCWVEIPALEVQRGMSLPHRLFLRPSFWTDPGSLPAKAFYTDVWGWTFTPNPPGNTRYTDDCMAMYTFPSSKLMGGIMKRDETSIRKTKTGALVYLYAESIEDQVEVCYSSIIASLIIS